MTMIMPLLLNRSGIQKVKVLPEPVGHGHHLLSFQLSNHILYLKVTRNYSKDSLCLAAYLIMRGYEYGPSSQLDNVAVMLAKLR